MKNNDNRYNNMVYRRLGDSGLKLPVISLGLWYNFGSINDYEVSKEMIMTAFNNGITHFDLANNYGPPAGSAEETFGKILKEELADYRDELIISTKAGYGMWPGPYGDGGSRKYLFASLNQSLKRLGLEYVDIFYHHRPDTETNIRETMTALADIIRMGKALYVGLSNYNSAQLKEAVSILKELNVPYVITQPSYSMFNRWIEEDDLLNTQYELGGGTICFSVLQQGMLTNKYITGVPKDSRALKEHCEWFNKEDLTPQRVKQLVALNEIAQERGQTLSQMAISWALRNKEMTSVLMGASKPSQIIENIESIKNLDFSNEELAAINSILEGMV